MYENKKNSAHIPCFYLKGDTSMKKNSVQVLYRVLTHYNQKNTESKIFSFRICCDTKILAVIFF